MKNRINDVSEETRKYGLHVHSPLGTCTDYQIVYIIQWKLCYNDRSLLTQQMLQWN